MPYNISKYYDMLDAVKNYYGKGSDEWLKVAQYGVNVDTIPIMEQVPGVFITRSNSGKFLGYDYIEPFETVTNPASEINSNVQTGAYGAGSFNAKVPGTAVTNPSTGVTTMTSGAKVASTGATLATVADRAFLALAGVSMGTKLGKAIDSTLYSLSPDWWDTHYPTINPETWDDIASSEGGKNFIRSIFGLQNDDTTMYLDERLLAYTYMLLSQNGAYSETSEATIADTTGLTITHYTIPFGIGKVIKHAWDMTTTKGVFCYEVNNDAYLAYFRQGPSSPNYYTIMASRNPFSYRYMSLGSWGGWVSAKQTSFNGQKFYYVERSSNDGNNVVREGTRNIATGELSSSERLSIGYIIAFGQITTGGLDGVQDNPNASTYIDPNLINGTTPEQVLQQLKDNYPELFDGSIYEDVPQPDGTTERIRYIPVPYPDTTDKTKPTTDTTPGVDPQTQPQVNPETRPQPQIDDLIDTLTSDPTPPDTGDGDTPPAVIPTGTANALYSIYNPSQSELNSFGAWLWSSNFVDQLLKVFNDPMQAIIGLHKVFAQPGISGTSTIHVGYLDSEVSSNVVGDQYTTIDCGSVNVSEYFGNVFDYDPFTQIYIYLPFIGIEKLDTGDVMRGRIGVKYHVDVLTGACLAEIKVTRDGSGGILYTYAGNCAVQYPISSGSYMGIVASMASIAGGVVGTVASGGALAPVAMGAVSGALNAHTRVQHSGGFSGNAGAMGVKKPYLIITRPQTALADGFPAFDGYPANKRTTISACSGFVKCETCHIENVPATDAELNEIETLLKEGIII